MRERVVERYVLAPRVAARVLNADSFGDPSELLKEFAAGVERFVALKNTALDLQAKYRALAKAEAEFQTAPVDQLKEKSDTLRDLRKSIPSGGQDSYVLLGGYVSQYGVERARNPANNLCLAILQQLALPPRLRKSIEAAAKFWAKSGRRWKPKSKYHTHAYEAEIVERYLDDVELLTKYQDLFTAAVAAGKPHSDVGETATKLKAGSFTLINTGGFGPDDMARVGKLVEEAEHLMRGIGLDRLCYGDVHITNRIHASSNVQAFYMGSKDEMFVRADAKVSLGAVHVVCHELTHRYCKKFMSGEAKQGMTRIYHRIKDEPVDFPKIGDEIFSLSQGKKLRVKDYDFRRKSITLDSPDDAKTCICGQPVDGHKPDVNAKGEPEAHKAPIVQRYVYKMPLEAYNQAAGKPRAPGALTFVTGYAEKGGPEENFCEMVAFYAMGKLPPQQVELLKPLL